MLSMKDSEFYCSSHSVGLEKKQAFVTYGASVLASFSLQNSKRRNASLTGRSSIRAGMIRESISITTIFVVPVA